MLIDSTLREGEQTFGVYLDAGLRRAIAGRLFAAGVDELEAGWVGREGLADFLAWAAPRAGGTVLSLWSPCRVADVAQAAALGAARVNIGVPASEAHREKRLGLSRAQLLARVREVVRAALSGGVPYVSVGLEDVSRADLGVALALAEAAVVSGASRVRLSDTVGILSPLATAELLGAFARNIPADLAFHGHNDMGMATANAVTALASGAAYADVTALGLGERAGIARLEEVAAYLRFRAGAGRYDMAAIGALCAEVARVAGRKVERAKAVVGEDVFATESGLHAHGLARDPELFEPFAPEAVGARRKLAVGAKSGRASVRDALRRLGRSESEEGILPRVRALACRLGRPLTDQELLGVL